MCRTTQKNEAGVRYTLMSDRRTMNTYGDVIRTDFCIVRRTDGPMWIEVYQQVFGQGKKRVKNSYASVTLKAEDVRFLASALVEMSSTLLNE